jgi:glycosyltransferase involved in cell wall biosynthesis
MKDIKVLHLITHLGVGGAQDNTLLTVKGHSRDRYEVHLAAGQDETDWVDRGREYADAFYLFPALYRSVSPIADIQVLSQLTRFIKEHNYDIVHTHSAKAGTVGRIAARRANVPIIIHTFHSFGWQVAHTFHTSSRRNYTASIKKRLYILIERYVASISDALITVSELNKEEAIDLNLAPAVNFTNMRLNPDQPIVGTIGRLSIQKAPLDFITAAKIVLQQKPDIQFIMVGDGPLAPEVRQAIGDEPRIKVLGYRDDVPEILSILDVFALSSLWEGLGRALTEAMIMGVPVAVTAVDGVPELVTHQETGLLSPLQDPIQLAKNVVWLLEHPKAAREIGQRAREHVVPNFGVKQMVDKIETLYERQLADKGYAKILPHLGRTSQINA